MLEFTTQNFDAEVLKSEQPVVVDFWAEWCGPCRVFSPVIESVENEYKNRIKFGKLNIDANTEIASKYNIMSIPSVLMFEGGEVKAMSVGALPKDSIKKWIDKNL